MMKIPMAAVCLVALVVVTGCGSASGSPSAPSLGGTTVEFAPQNGPAENAVTLALRESTNDTAIFDVLTRAMGQPVTGAALEFNFDPGSLSLQGATAGPMFFGQTVSRIAPASGQAGKLVAVFVQRDLGRGTAGSALLATLTMKLADGNHSSSIQLSSVSTLFGLNGVPIKGENFAGGTITVRR